MESAVTLIYSGIAIMAFGQGSGIVLFSDPAVARLGYEVLKDRQRVSDASSFNALICHVSRRSFRTLNEFVLDIIEPRARASMGLVECP